MTKRLENLICVEQLEGEWAVVFYPSEVCNIEQAMLLSKHGAGKDRQQFAERYRAQFIDTMRDYERD